MNDMLFAVMTFFVFLSAVALCIQAAMLIGVWKTTKALQQQVTSIMPRVQSVLTKAESTLDENRRNILDVTTKATELAAKANEIGARAVEMMDLGKAQLQKLDLVVTEATDRARVQLERAELVVDDTLGRVNQTVTAVHNGVLRPVREVQGIAAGVRAALDHLMRGGRPSVADATHDDEMFIG